MVFAMLDMKSLVMLEYAKKNFEPFSCVANTGWIGILSARLPSSQNFVVSTWKIFWTPPFRILGRIIYGHSTKPMDVWFCCGLSW
jgi:hypothetical protein